MVESIVMHKCEEDDVVLLRRLIREGMAREVPVKSSKVQQINL